MKRKEKIEAYQWEVTTYPEGQGAPVRVTRYFITKLTNTANWKIGQELTPQDVREILATNSDLDIVIRKVKDSDIS